METRTYNGVTYQRSGPGESWQRVGGGRVIPKSDTTTRKEGAEADKASIDAREATVTLPYAAPKAAADVANANLTGAKIAEEIETIRQNREKAEITANVRQDAIAGYQSADKLERVANDLEQRFKQGVGRTSGISGVLDYLPSGENSAFNSRSNQLRATIKQALGFTGGEGNTASESQINYGPYIPQTGDYDTDIKTKIQTLRELAADARRKAVATLGGVPDANGKVTPLSEGGLIPGQTVLPTASGTKAAQRAETDGAVAAGMQDIPELHGIQNEVMQMIANGSGAGSVYDFLREKLAPYGAQPDRGTLEWAQKIIDLHKANPNKPIASLGSGWELLHHKKVPEEDTTFLGRAAEDGFGNIVMNAANSALAGIPAAVAGKNDVLDAANSKFGAESFTGQLIGNLAGMKGLTGLAGMAGRAGRPLTAMNGLGADMAFGATQGFAEGDGDWRYGLLGAGAAGLGNRVGAAAFGGDTVTRPVEALLDTAPSRRIAQALGQEIPVRPTTGERIVGRAIGDNQDPVAMALAQGQALDMPVSLADTSPQLRSLAGAAFRRSGGEARNEVDAFQRQRGYGQADRAIDQIESAFGPVSNPNRVAEQLTAQARAGAAPLYEQAYAAPGRMTPELQSILDTPAGQQALRNARTIAANERRDPLALGFNDLDVEGNVALTRTPSMETLDLVKRGLDQVIEGRRDPVTGRLPTSDPSFSSVNGLRADLVRELDALNPDYAAARAAYAGPASAREAMELGQDFMRLPPRDVADQFGRMQGANADMYQLGARSAMADSVERARMSSDPYQALYGSPASRQRIEAIFPEGAERFGRAYDVEGQMAQTRNELLGGSPTAARMAAGEAFDNRLANEAANIGVDLLSSGGNLPVAGIGMVRRYLGSGGGLGVAGRREAAANEVARLLALEAQPDDEARLLAESAARRRYIDNLRSVGGGVGSASAIAAALAGGSGE